MLLPASHIEARGNVVLLIPCPYCGPRAEIEFHWGGESHLTRPGPYNAVTDAEWGAYLYYRENPRGLGRERWRHTFGCRQWFNLVRDTANHRILGSYRMGESPPTEFATREMPERAP